MAVEVSEKNSDGICPGGKTLSEAEPSLSVPQPDPEAVGRRSVGRDDVYKSVAIEIPRSEIKGRILHDKRQGGAKVAPLVVEQYRDARAGAGVGGGPPDRDGYLY